MDYDVVDLSNLQRQILHTEEKVGVAKVDSAIDFLKRFFWKKIGIRNNQEAKI